MKQLIVLGSILLASHVSSAAPPAWCGSERFDANGEDLRVLNSSQDIEEIVTKLANTLCSSNPEMEAHRGELDAARKAWGKKLGMSDADWAEAAAWVHYTDKSFKADISTKDITKLTPVDQYAGIRAGFGDGYNKHADPLYATDTLDQHLSDTGRMAFIDYCLTDENVARRDGSMAKWAVCWPDVEKFDASKVYAELSADSAHDGIAKMWLRLHAHALPAEIKKVADAKNALIKKDDAWQKVFDAANKARADWAKDVGTNAKLIDLALAMDGATYFHSRKLMEGCEPKTEEALATAIATIPAKSFTGWHDDNEQRKPGFAESAGPLLVNTPLVNIAGAAYAQCHHGTATADYLEAYLQNVPGSRGPRDYALGALMGMTFTFDDTTTDSKLEYPHFNARPYGRSGGAIMSTGGVVKSVKKDKDGLVVALEKTSIKQDDCVKEHRANHISRIRDDGSFEYEMICEKWATVTHDTTAADYHISAKFEKLLKPGVLFTSLYANHKPRDVIAVWPNKTAKMPAIVLGGAVK